MAGIESSIGKSSVSDGPSRRFIVSDESEQAQTGFNSPQERLEAARRSQQSQHHGTRPMTKDEERARIAQMRAQAQAQEQEENFKSTQEARRRIDILTGLGRLTRNVPIEVDGSIVNITLRTLKTVEQSMLAQVIEKAERVQITDDITVFSPTSAHKIRLEALTHSLFLIDGQDIDIVLGTYNADYESKIHARQALICEMDGALTEFLYKNYQELSKEAQDGYSPKTQEEGKEVVDTIRKSGQDT